MKSLLGIAIVVAHVVAFVVGAPRCERPQLSVELTPKGPVPSIADATVDHSGGAPGLDYTRFTVAYRGGFERSVGVAQLVGPRQDPAAHACVGRVVLGQRLLDDGHAGPGTIAGAMAREIERELAGESYVGVGAFQRVDKMQLAWAERLAFTHPYPGVRARLSLVFDRLEVPLLVLLVPKLGADKLSFDMVVAAQLELHNAALQWLSDKLGGNALATRLARRQVDANLVTALEPPPPFELPDGKKLQFGFCAGALEVGDGRWGALPFSVNITADPRALPTRRGPAKRAAVPPDVALAIDIDLDGLNALLYELWRDGFLDRRLADAGLDKRFNEDPLVADMLTLRISSPTLALPPVLSPAAHGLALHGDARVAIRDGDTTTVGRVWGGLSFGFSKQLAPVGVDLSELELACEQTPSLLVPCFADLVAAMRDRGDQLHGELTRAFGKLLADVFVDRRVGGPGMPVELVIRRATPSVTTAAENASLRLDLDASLAPAR